MTEVYIDDDVSAWSGRTRPAYARMLADIEARKLDAVVCYDLDRLHRQPRELEAFFDSCDRAGVTKLASVSGDVDLASSDGQLIARIMGAVAKKSSDDTSRRIKRRFQDDAEAGKPHGPRAFGYNPDRLSINRPEAKLVKEMVRRVLAGEPLNAIARDLNERGVSGPQGGRGWAGTTVRAVVSNPRLAGLRAHHGVIVGEAQWPGIIDRPTHERIVAHFAVPGRSRTSPARLNLLSGFMTCGRCGGLLNYSRRGDWPMIACQRAPGRPNCGGVGVSARALENLVVEALLQRFESERLADAAGEADDADAVAEVVKLESRMTELGELFAAGDISRGEWIQVRASIDKRLSAARKAIAAAGHQRHRSIAVEGMMRDAWPKLELQQRRTIIEAAIDKIVVKPTRKRGPKFDEDRIDVVWRESASA